MGTCYRYETPVKPNLIQQVCDYPGCNMSVPSPQPGQNPCFGAAIHALMCCTSPTSAKEETNPSKFVGISSEGDEVEVKVTDIQEDFPTEIVLVNDTDAFVCGNTGSRVGCPSGTNHFFPFYHKTGYKASGLCLGQNCPALTGCGSQYNYVVQCSKYNQKSTCMWVFLWEHSELQCGDGYIAGFCDTFPGKFFTFFFCAFSLRYSRLQHSVGMSIIL